MDLNVGAARSYTISTARPLSVSALQPPIYSAVQVNAVQGAHVAVALHQETERANLEQKRAETAEHRLLRSMAHFSALRSQLSHTIAARHGSAAVASVESRNELGELAAWSDFLTTSPVQFLKAELRTPLSTAVLKRGVSRCEIVVPLTEGGSLGFKILPDLSITEAHRDNIECREGDKIVAVDGVEMSSVDDLRASLKGKHEVKMTIESGGPFLKVVDAYRPYWEVASIASTAVVQGDLGLGDLILRVNNVSVHAGIDLQKILETTTASVDYIPGASKVAQRIRKEGLMSFSTKVILFPTVQVVTILTAL